MPKFLRFAHEKFSNQFYSRMRGRNQKFDFNDFAWANLKNFGITESEIEFEIKWCVYIMSQMWVIDAFFKKWVIAHYSRMEKNFKIFVFKKFKGKNVWSARQWEFFW